MKVIVMSKTSLDVVQYNNVSSITKANTTISIVYGGTPSTTVTVNTTTHIVRIMES